MAFDWKSFGSSAATAGLNTAGGLISGSLNYRYNKKLAEQQFGYTNQLMDKENQFNIDMWNRQNEYNSPAAQAQRFADAGFNPAFMMQGQGTPAAQELNSENPQFAMPQGSNFSFGALGSDAVNAYISQKQMLADLKVKEATAKKAMQDASTSKSQEHLNEANAAYQELLSKWESMSQDDRLEGLQAQVNLYKVQELLSSDQAKVIEEELPYISRLKQAELDSINKSIEEAASRIIANKAQANSLNADAKLKLQEAVYYQLQGDVASAEKLLKEAETAFYKTNDQKTRFEGLKILEETKKAAEEAAISHVKRVFLKRGWNVDGSILNNLGSFFLRSFGGFVGSAVDVGFPGSSVKVPFSNGDFDGSSLEKLDSKLDSEMTRALAGNHHHVYRNPNTFRMKV